MTADDQLEPVTIVDKRAQRRADKVLTEHLRNAQRDQLAANVRQLAGTTWWAAQSSPTPDEVLASRDALVMEARMQGLDV
ncbi:hypothetical protein SEA_VINCENZO_73 [Mycobacterium phage Vincenzo]|uniref:Uncharacterized protein n=2 Tax=Coopervirus vincenzo TaxID=1983110 RepID=A0A0F6WDT1_9CAUD|nr:hypothetical protein SEA_VINCENZO_73 [Mycobacterium phage Vincenzo]AKF14335.1 hypothetical protein SEA_VINCENZO_73 [Mycobacterium phage Vincenzo]AKF14739.1 hypothetical protein SEA_ALANGRANT_74 [Mycobacterium phage AlanGrant]